MEHIREMLPRAKINTALTRGKELTNKLDCKTCGDAGFIHPLVDGLPEYSCVVPCECQKEEIQRAKYQRMLKVCALPDGKSICTFENFDAYNDSLKRALMKTKKFASGKDDTKWLTMHSKVDTGKSHLAVAICKMWIDRGVPARYIFVPDLLDQLRNSFVKTSETESYSNLMQFFLEVPLLVLDDLGTQKTSDWAKEKIIQIINHRYEYQLHLVVTMNCTLDEIPGDTEGRIASRLQREDWSKVLWLDAPEYSQYKRERK